MKIQEFILYGFALLGFYTALMIIWHETNNFRYNFKLKYILKPKFKKGDYALIPNRNDNPTLVLIKSVSSSWVKNKVEYTVYPVNYSNEYIDYEYFEEFLFTEDSLMKIRDYCENSWNKKYNKE